MYLNWACLLEKLVLNGNPANGVETAEWRKEITKEIYQYIQQHSLYDLDKRLTRWALTEYKNEGSHMRATCPLTLKGSGRWLANDRGGRYSILLNIVLQAFEAGTIEPWGKFRTIATLSHIELQLENMIFNWDYDDRIKRILQVYLIKFYHIDPDTTNTQIEEPLEEPLNPDERLEEWEEVET